ncbi:MAG: transferase [Bacteroidetes bacterium]|jgi:carbamoyltransferase|nr:transferase [Bacteroidota bacterium]
MSTYIIGTGLSHDGSSCLLKDGEIIIAIEKERLTRVKHDGGNDYLTVKYCLDHAGIELKDVSLIVQASNFENKIKPEQYQGKRYFDADITTPVITISHHLAHAWGAAATSPFSECNVMVIDAAGSPYKQCLEVNQSEPQGIGMFCEKDSFYYFDGKTLKPVCKDFSEVRLFEDKHRLKLPTNYHSIGGLYSAASFYMFGNMDDAGKLMGLAPYGKLNGKPSLFNLENGKIEVNYNSVNAHFTNPSCSYNQFKEDFSHYADMACWVQHETEKAVLYLFKERLGLNPHPNMVYTGGVALNAVTNHLLLKSGMIENLFVQPSAGDNGLAIGCAYYGWCEILKTTKKVNGSLSPFSGRSYAASEIETAIRLYETDNNVRLHDARQIDNVTEEAACLLADGKVVGWFTGGAEFGPRALGHRSILADPRVAGIKEHINSKIKFREDFRPFAPAVRLEDVDEYFIYGWESPYMILVDKVKPEWKQQLAGVVHQDETCRAQTVTPEWNQDFYDLISKFREKTGLGVLLNTSLNKRGMPIVETPLQAIDLFFSGAMDVLVIDNFMIKK